ncbi:hypothetical protein B0H34DRAFT_729067 [Crassisporium funariophilum]|nr:hypothetical protein B0H34DRAFT_729067 [Crassisporium funariophilum]
MPPWTSQIMDSFQSIKPDLEPDFTPAAYNKLLNSLFPVNTPYAVYPEVQRNIESSSSATFTIYYRHSPVFLLDLHSYHALRRTSVREAADDHIRKHMRDLLPYCPMSVLHAVSAFGTRLCFYTVALGDNIKPARSPPEIPTRNDETPMEWWDCDLLDDDGAIRLKEVVNKIRNKCETF